MEESRRCETINTDPNQNSVKSVDSNDLSQISLIRQDNIASSAKNIGQNTAPSNEKHTEKNKGNTTENDIRKTQRLGLNEHEKVIESEGLKSSNIMEEEPPHVSVVENRPSNFSVLTTLTVEVISTAKKLKRKVLDLFIDGSKKTNIPKDSGSCATTVIPLSAITATVPTGNCKTCGESTEQVIVMLMDYKYLVEMVCEWRGAGRAQGTPDVLAWYTKNKNKMRLNAAVRERVEEMLGYK